MDELKLRDAYDAFLESRFDEVGIGTSYADGYWDGAYSFFADLLGEPS